MGGPGKCPVGASGCWQRRKVGVPWDGSGGLAFDLGYLTRMWDEAWTLRFIVSIHVEAHWQQTTDSKTLRPASLRPAGWRMTFGGVGDSLRSAGTKGTEVKKGPQVRRHHQIIQAKSLGS